MKLSLIFPAYNEAESIVGVLERFTDYCLAHSINHEIIVVNDGSKDSTGVELELFASGHSTVRVLDHTTNLGYGAALRSGFSAAHGDYIFFTDSDGQFSPADLDRTVSLLEPRSIILGYREGRTEGWLRKFNARLWGQCIRLCLGVRVQDLNCAWKLFPRAVLTDTNLMANGAFINAELLFYARKKNLVFQEIPVHHYPRQSGTPTGANIRVIGRAFRELGLFLILRRRHHEPFR